MKEEENQSRERRGIVGSCGCQSVIGSNSIEKRSSGGQKGMEFGGNYYAFKVRRDCRKGKLREG